MIGSVLPGSSASTAGSCVLTFGSSNDTSTLRVSQEDRHGSGMFQYSAGVPDGGYGTAGLATMAAIGTGHAGSYGVASAPDGKTLILGSSISGGNSVATVQRVNADGSPDSTFGTGGVVTVAAGTSDVATYADVLPDGRIVVLGTSNEAVLTFRLLPDGALDTAYATNGVGRYAAPSLWALTRAVKLSNGTRILVGRCWASSSWQVCMHAITSNGFVDTSWGASGMRASNDPSTDVDGPTLVVDAADRIYVAVVYSGANRRKVFRVTSTGAIDATFGTAGYADTGLAVGSALGIGLQSTGKLIVSRSGGVARLNSDGSLDTTFGAAGLATPTGSLTPTDVLVLPDDSIMVTGGTTTGATFAKLRPDGSVDSSFGTSGSGAVSVGTGIAPIRRVLATAFDGSIITNAAVSVATTNRLAAARIVGIPVGDYGAGTTWTTGTSQGMFGSCLQSATNVVSSWTPNGTCPMSDGGWWNPIPASSAAATSKVAQAASGVTNASATLKFGLRASATQRAGNYFAPIVFGVVAPAV